MRSRILLGSNRKKTKMSAKENENEADDQKDASSSAPIKWTPLEANPDVLNALASKIGVDLSTYVRPT